MAALILLGEPLMGVDPNSDLVAPLGQFKLCQITRLATSPAAIVDNLKKEYLAIAQALCAMSIDFRIVYAHPEVVDKQVLGVCVQVLGCRLAGMPPVSGSLTAFPRDFGFDLPSVSLLSPHFGELIPGVVKDKKAEVSFYGEGGRVLFRQDTVLIAEKISRGGFSNPCAPEFFEKEGLRVGIIPNPVAKMQHTNGAPAEFFTNDHLDRVACLIEGQNNSLHLIIDPLFQAGPRECPASPDESIARIQRVCDRLKIELRVPRTLRVPYSLGLQQFEDGRVLMTRGEDDVAAIVAEIIGKENLFLTEIPIRHYPAWTFAGIRCLIGEAPSIFFKPVQNTTQT